MASEIFRFIAYVNAITVLPYAVQTFYFDISLDGKLGFMETDLNRYNVDV